MIGENFIISGRAPNTIETHEIETLIFELLSCPHSYFGSSKALSISAILKITVPS